MCALFSETALFAAESFESAPPPCIPPSEESSATVNEWGVWLADSSPQDFDCLTALTESESRVRCLSAAKLRTALAPDSKCVFKRAFATAATTAAGPAGRCLLGAGTQCEMGTRPVIRRPKMLPPPISSDLSLISSKEALDSSHSSNSPFNHSISSLSPSTYSSSSYSPQLKDIDGFGRDFSPNISIPFIDSIIAEVRQELNDEESASDITSVSRRDLYMKPGETITIRAEDGKEYKVIIEPVEPENDLQKCAPKRKSSVISTTSTSTVDSSPSPVRPKIKRKRAAPVSLANMSMEEIAERKKQQNRMAAIRYRQKLREERSSDEQEKTRLTARNAFLREEQVRLEKEIADIRALLFANI
ncbi:unnamed protein product [Caenorhabditis bovis]|uniref:BZIP domain-containing protein n=1 Tax=Caenorhabditis bovis TaxID=2654633 RepID=A0A8S1E722_9PELO|nr:unnamed protein product [Caenorhabditis bovis]